MTVKKNLFFLFYFFLALLPSAYAKGHEKCKLCHTIVDKKPAGIKIKPETKTRNKFTGKPYSHKDGICITCHPVFKHRRGHIYGVKPKKVKVPSELIGKGNIVGCNSCHDPHANKSYKYLRTEINGLAEVLHLCVLCHPKNANAHTLQLVQEKLKRLGSKIILLEK